MKRSGRGESSTVGMGSPEPTRLLGPLQLSDTAEVPRRNDKNAHTELGAWGVTSMHPGPYGPLISCPASPA